MIFLQQQLSTEKHTPSIVIDNNQKGNASITEYVKMPTDEKDVWEIDVHQLKFGNRIASGAFGDL